MSQARWKVVDREVAGSDRRRELAPVQWRGDRGAGPGAFVHSRSSTSATSFGSTQRTPRTASAGSLFGDEPERQKRIDDEAPAESVDRK